MYVNCKCIFSLLFFTSLFCDLTSLVAGYDPHNLDKVAVYAGTGDSHALEAWGSNPDQLPPGLTQGCSKNMLANMVSQIFHWSGTYGATQK